MAVQVTDYFDWTMTAKPFSAIGIKDLQLFSLS